jgi:hypothetical protein
MKTFLEQIAMNENAVSAGPAPVNSMGAGIDGLSSTVGDGIAGYDKLMMGRKKMLRRKPHDYFGGKPVFKVRSEDYHKAVHGKKYRKHYKSYVSGELGEEVREFAAQNPNTPIIVQDEVTGAMFYLRYGRGK